MKVTESPTETANTIERIRRQMVGSRAPGIHVSDLVGCLRKAFARSHGLVSQEIDPSTVLLFATGRAVQDYITGQKAEVSEVEKVWDGIHGTIDKVEDGMPLEVKATYISAASSPSERSPHYFDQLATYCIMLGTAHGRLAIFYVNGYYDFMRKKPRAGAVKGERSVLKVYDVVFRVDELAAWSAEVRERAEILRAAKVLEDIPLGAHYTWECEYCPLKGRECAGGEGWYGERSVVNDD